MIRTLLTAAVFMGLSFSAMAQTPEIDPAKKVEINKMLELTGMNKLMDQMVDQMIASFQSNTATQDISKEFWTKFRTKVDTTQLIEKMIPIYTDFQKGCHKLSFGAHWVLTKEGCANSDCKAVIKRS